MFFDIKAYTGKYCMHCKTSEEAKDFCNYLHSIGKKWCGGASYEQHTYFSVYEDKMVYIFNNDSYADIDYATTYNYTILEWSDFMKQTFTKRNLKTGDVILRRNGTTEIYNGVLDMFITQGHWNGTNYLNDDLTNKIGKGYDIVAVRRPVEKHDCVFAAFENKRGTLVYERKEIEEMTLEEVCRLLGKEIKIVKGN